jgi:hypothetical protein
MEHSEHHRIGGKRGFLLGGKQLPPDLTQPAFSRQLEEMEPRENMRLTVDSLTFSLRATVP